MTTHQENKVIPHTPENLFQLVMDIKSYPDFLPWCVAARIKSQKEQKIVADLMIGFRLYRERFTSHVDFDLATKIIKVEYAEGPFKYLKNSWEFKDHPDGCEIDFYVDFEFKSQLFQSVVETLFSEAVKKMVNAFEKRADNLYEKVN